ncbi:MAG: RNA methyltransferase [Nitrospinae bacterium]|nr:RNA methyltransferase [Nitrospinota bacterium]MDA1110655.1 RNA methyltransferase [Nitrospinota bacterium]
MAEGFHSNIHMALVHFPVYNKIGEVVVSSVTTLDVHDSSRISRTYGIGALYIVTPLKTQQELVDRIISHWKTGHGATYNPTRKEALLKTQVINSLQDAIQDITEHSGKKPRIIVTHAKKFPKNIGYDAMREEFKKDEQYLLVFGTGWGLERNIILNADFVLSPIEGPEEYNHLPVRAAIAIILDRLLGIRS